MSRSSRGDALRGASKLAIGATKGVTQLVEELHRTIASGPALLGSPLEGPAALLTRAIYGSIRGTTDLVGASIDAAIDQVAPLLGNGVPSSQQQAVVAALNGVLGDYLQKSQNPLATQMAFREPGDTLGPASRKLVVLVHGSCMWEGQWTQDGHDHGLALARDHGFAPLYLRYNSGLHISTNGAQLADLLESVVHGWSEPIEEIMLLGYSMGGLVARSACHAAEKKQLRWRTLLRKLVCLGSPHHGAPLERAGNWVEAMLGVTPYTAPFVRLAQIRSAGVTDLRYGNVLDEHWSGQDRFALAADRRTNLPLPTGVDCHAIAASTSRAPNNAPLGDGMVPVDSALGRHADPTLEVRFPEENQSIVYAANHLDLLDSPTAYRLLSDT